MNDDLRQRYHADLVRVLASVPGLPPCAVESIARLVEAQVAVWRLIPDALEDAGADELPELFRYATGRDTLDGLLAFVCRYSGQRIYVPLVLPQDHAYAQVAGPAATAHLLATYGGSAFTVPSADGLFARVRAKAIFEDYKAGASLDQLVRDYDLGFERVHRIIKQAWRTA